MDEAIKAGDALTATLSEEQKALLEDYINAQREVNILTNSDAFICSFRFGAKIMLDVLTESEMKEIRLTWYEGRS